MADYCAGCKSSLRGAALIRRGGLPRIAAFHRRSAMSSSRAPIRLHRLKLSGHCHRVELFLSLLGLPYECVEVDLAGGEHKQPPFLALNPAGQVPVIEDGEVTLADSNAILVYLDGKYAGGDWMPRDPLGAAQVQRWFSAAAGPLAFGAAAARVVNLFGRSDDKAPMLARAQGLLQLMEQRLAQASWLAADRPTLADVAMYSYTRHAPEGGVSLADFPAVRRWLGRIEALPGFVPMPSSPVGLNG
jgi:glutathione S-transferase